MSEPRANAAVLAVLAMSVASCALVVSFDEYIGVASGDDGPHYGVNGTIDGLTEHATVKLRLNGVTPAEAGNGLFAFPSAVAAGAKYTVTLEGDPPNHHCVVADGVGTVTTGDASGVAVHCIPPPMSVTCTRDADPQEGFAGVVRIGKAADETNVTSYELYWASEAQPKLSKLASLPKTTADLAYTIAGDAGVVPSNTTRLVAVTANATEEMASGVSTPISNNRAVVVDGSGGQGNESGTVPSAVVDAVNGKLLVVTNDGASSYKPGLFRCNLDGTSCTYTDISAGQGANSGGTPSAVVDASNGKLLAVANNGANSHKPGLFRCNLDGTSCTHTDISAGQGANSGSLPSAVIDEANRKLLVATEDGSTAGQAKPSLFRCNLDGTSCTHTDLSAGQGAASWNSPSAVVDAVGGKLLVVTTHSPSQRPSLFRCNLDGTSCTHTDLSAGQGTNSSGERPSAVIDAANGKLLVVTRNNATSGDARLGLFRCNLDGTSCTQRPDFGGVPINGALGPSAVIDAANGKLLVVAIDGSDSATLFRSDLDGTGLTRSSLATFSSNYRPSAAIDAANGNLLVALTNKDNGSKLSIAMLGLW